VIEAAVAAYLEANVWHAEAIQCALDDIRSSAAKVQAV
jgi:hypothetical protein